MPVFVLVAMALAGCGALGAADRLLWPGQYHAPRTEEVAYVYLAWDLR